MDTLTRHGRALTRFGELVQSVGAGHWHAPTPCTEWDVRQLVNHLVVEQLWVPPIVAGRTVAEIGDAFQGDQLGADPVAAWDKAAAASGAAFAEPGALQRTVHLSYGDRPAEPRQLSHGFRKASLPPELRHQLPACGRVRFQGRGW